MLSEKDQEKVSAIKSELEKPEWIESDMAYYLLYLLKLLTNTDFNRTISHPIRQILIEIEIYSQSDTEFQTPPASKLATGFINTSTYSPDLVKKIYSMTQFRNPDKNSALFLFDYLVLSLYLKIFRFPK